MLRYMEGGEEVEEFRQIGWIPGNVQKTDSGWTC